MRIQPMEDLVVLKRLYYFSTRISPIAAFFDANQ